MNNRLKLGLWVALAIVLAAAVGWLYGWSGGRSAATALESTKLRTSLLQARVQLLDARVNLYSVNFGDASRNLEYAKPELTTARALLDSAGRRDLVDKIDGALKSIRSAQELSAKLSQDANGRAGEAASLVNDVLQATK
jgi:hypothetical protein